MKTTTEDEVAVDRAFRDLRRAVEAAVYAAEALSRTYRLAYGPHAYATLDVYEEWADRLADVLGDVEQGMEVDQ